MDLAPRDTLGVARGPDPKRVAHVPDPKRPDPASLRSRSWLRDLPVLLLVAAALTLVVRLFLVQAFYIPSGSMEPTLDVGDRVLVSRVSTWAGEIHRGDVVVFDGSGSFAASPAQARAQQPTPGLLGRAARSVGSVLGIAPSERDFVKRVVGIGGDHVVCCDAQGRVNVNGRALDEPYLMDGDAPSSTPFDVTVPAGRLWVMGDHRSRSADSRAHLGDPGGGTVPLDHVIGTVVLRFWPLDRFGTLPDSTFGDRP